MHIEVGSYEAKTKLPELVPAQGNRSADAVRAVEDMQRFMRAAPPVSGVDLKALIDEGRP